MIERPAHFLAPESDGVVLRQSFDLDCRSIHGSQLSIFSEPSGSCQFRSVASFITPLSNLEPRGKLAKLRDSESSFEERIQRARKHNHINFERLLFCLAGFKPREQPSLLVVKFKF